MYKNGPNSWIKKLTKKIDMALPVTLISHIKVK